MRTKALDIGAADAFVRDARVEFAAEYVAPAIKANALYGGRYPLFTALASSTDVIAAPMSPPV